MEERIIDNEREIKIKRKRGGDDVVDALASDGEELEEEEELILELPEGDDYDEDLVGLTPTQLKEELARREKAKREAQEECEKLTSAGEEKLSEENYEEAEPFFSQALLYDAESARAGKGLWISRTHNFAGTEAFYTGTHAEELSVAPEEVRTFVLEQVGEKLKAEREEYRAEAEPLRESVQAEQAARREPFLANRNYYRLRFGIVLAATLICVLGAIISASFIYSSKGMLPVWLTVGFGAAALVCAAVLVLYARKLLVAQRLCAANEKLSSTEEGARLQYLEERLGRLELLLGE